MRLRRRRREEADELWDDAAEVEDLESLDDAGEELTGWQASTASLSGLARLARIGTWVFLASGPVLGIAAFTSSASPAESKKPAAAVQTASPIAPTGFAQLFVGAYLEAGQGTESSLSPYFADPVVLTNPPASRSASRIVAVSSSEVEPGYWSVTVAARVIAKNKKGETADQGLQYFRVGVQVVGPSSAGGTAKSPGGPVGYAATSLPAQVAAPAALRTSGLGYGTPKGNGTADPVVDTASSFLNAYLVGSGELDRYISPGTHVEPIAPTPYTSVKITDAYDNGPSGGSLAVPSDGAARRLLVMVTATDSTGQSYPLTYALDLRSRGGRWEVWAVAAAPAIKSGAKPSTAPAPIPSPDPARTSTPSPSAP
ncbi:conjugal transfer protein [Kitasatospora sp. NBC_00240]|uniref:conjugal transfer protein n=1 Tax=Kitasatospora sp. NBC_00240 TaxID=2903567 RepID=UPI002252A84E|nr:conjugal transfer protein [Kitasatospora sp. NBC_00240]MCX5216191.1 conjugal transfer protein [Kitasatospora sp. NBC_00240]